MTDVLKHDLAAEMADAPVKWRADGNDPWDDPLPLDDPRLPVMPVASLPEPAAELAVAVADGAECISRWSGPAHPTSSTLRGVCRLRAGFPARAGGPEPGWRHGSFHA